MDNSSKTTNDLDEHPIMFPDLPLMEAPKRHSLVYVVQETNLNLIKATKFGELIPLLPARTNITMNPIHIVRDLKRKLKNFTDADYLLPIGDPIAIGLAFTIAGEINMGKFRALKWDRQAGDYYVVSCNINDKD